MKLVLTLPAIVALIGGVVFAVAKADKPGKLGLVAFGCGLLALLFGLR